jgi:very-short-patch-repair endonuclease
MTKFEVCGERRRFAKQLRKRQTTPESQLWHELRAGRLDGRKFKRQVPLGVYVADFVCLAAKLVVEIDGPLHDEPEQRARDAIRDVALREQGLRIPRFSAATALATMLASIRDSLRAAPSPDPRASARATLSHEGRGHSN